MESSLLAKDNHEPCTEKIERTLDEVDRTIRELAEIHASLSSFCWTEVEYLDR
jgi:hypothetical protein